MKALEDLEGPSFKEIEPNEVYNAMYSRYILPIQLFKKEGDSFLKSIAENTFRTFAANSPVQNDVNFLIRYLSQTTPDTTNPELIDLFVQRIECIKHEEYELIPGLMQEIRHKCMDDTYETI